MILLNKNENRIFSINLAKKIIFCLVLIFIFDFFLFPAPILAAEMESNNEGIINNEIITEEKIVPETLNILPANDDLTVKFIKSVAITAYNSEVNQCDDSPCITANGFNLCEYGIEDTIAVNFLEFGTKVRIPELYGDKIFVVRDRMHSRYKNRIDIWMLEKQDALNFGIQYAKIEVLEP